MKKPYDLVREHYTLPFTLFPKQEDIVNQLAPLPRSGCYAQVGTGKTAMSTVVALYKRLLNRTVTLVTMPPILLRQWARWLRSVKGIGRVVEYCGTPTERQRISFHGAEWVLMSMQIFKKDYARLFREFANTPLMVVVDEATCIKNVGSDNYKCLRDFSAGQDLMLLTGTPLSSPADAYAYIKLVAPHVYRNQRHFENIHVAQRDFFRKVTEWDNLELLAENMKVNSVRLLKQEVLPDLDEPLYVPIHYQLAPAHYKLYKQLAEDQLFILENGGKIDATTASRLYSTLQQIVVNYGHFIGEPGKRPAAFDLIDEVLAEIGENEKLLIFANYRMTNRLLLEYLAPYKAVSCYSEISQAQQQRNVEQFVTDPSCRVFLAQPLSGGYGIDSLQTVCSEALFIESPVVPKDFEQAVGRLFRSGQRRRVTVRIAIAEGTLQNRLHQQLLKNDALVNSVQGNFKDLREAIYGA